MNVDSALRLPPPGKELIVLAAIPARGEFRQPFASTAGLIPVFGREVAAAAKT